MLQNEQQKLDIKRAERLMNQAANDYRQKTILEEAPGRIRNLELASWIPSVFSIVTASFLIIYLAQPYTLLTKIGVIIILGAVIIVNEIVKRRTVKHTVQSVHKGQRPSFIIVSAAVLTMIISMGSSFVGGNNGVQQNIPRPTLAANPTVDSLNREIQALNASIATYENTTWKGRIVRDANKNLTIVNAMKADLLAQKNALAAKDQQAHQATLSKFEQQLISFGIIFGGLAALCDFFLVGISSAIERVRRDLYDAYYDDPSAFAQAITAPAGFFPQGPTPTPEPPRSRRPRDPKVRDLHDRNPAPTESHHSDEGYDPAELVDQKGSYSVATNDSNFDREREVRKCVAAYKDAKKNLDAWLTKQENGKGKQSTLTRNIEKWERWMDDARKELEALDALSEIEHLQTRA